MEYGELMSTRIVWRAPKDYTPAAFDTLILALNQRLDESSPTTKSADPTRSVTIPTITEVVNNLVIGRGHYFELTVNGADAGLTGIAGGEPGRIIILKNVAGSANSLPLIYDSSASTLGNRFINRAGTNVTVPIGGARVLMYSGELRGWVPIAEVP